MNPSLENRPGAPILCIAPTPAVQRTLFFRAYRPGEVNRAEAVRVSPAGKGINVALALARMGAPVRLVGFIGGGTGDFIADAVRAIGIEAHWLACPEPTRQCHTILETDTGRVTELVEEAAPVPMALWSDLCAAVVQRLPGACWLAASGTPPPGAPPDFLARLCRAAGEAGVRACVDSHGAPLLACLGARPAMIKLNREELVRTCGEASVDRAAASLIRGGAEQVVVTDGPRGATAYTGAGSLHVPAPGVRALNPIGSGDSFTAGLLLALAAGQSLGDALRCANACGAANAETETPADLSPARVRDLMRAVVDPLAEAGPQK